MAKDAEAPILVPVPQFDPQAEPVVFKPPQPKPFGEAVLTRDTEVEAMGEGERYHADQVHEASSLEVRLSDPGKGLLGRWIVRLGERQAVKELRDRPLADRQLAYQDMVALKEFFLTKRAVELRNIRSTLTNLPPLAQQTLDRFLHGTDAPLGIDLHEQEQGAGVEAATAAPITEWLSAKASDEELVRFLRWHVKSLSEQQHDQQFDSQVAEIKGSYASAVRKAIEDGWLPKSAEEGVGAVDSVQVVIGDMFDTYLMRNAVGYHYRGTDYVVVAQGIGPTAEKRLQDLYGKMRDTVPHELNHSLLGSLDTTWLNEAITEHLAQSFVHGDIETINPRKRSGEAEETGAYYMERSLLWNMLTFGDNGEISPRLAFQAYASKGEEKRRAARAFEAALDASWGVENAWFYIRARHETIMEELVTKEPHRSLAVRRSMASERLSAELQLRPERVFDDSYEMEQGALVSN